MEAGIQFHPWGLTTLRSARQAVRTMNRDTLSTMATVVVAVIALGAFVRDEIGDVRDEIRDVRDDIADVRADITEIRDDIADLRERMVRVEVLLGVSRIVAGELTPGHEDSALR